MAIQARGKTVWVDTGGIADAEVFPQAIRNAIEQSDAFVFVISPDSADSNYCEQEVEHAREMRKRIVPVLRRSVPDGRLHEEIRDRNWIPFSDAADFEPSVDRLLTALDTDLPHVKEHTRWLVKALEWDVEARDRSFLLRGSELRSAESWLAAADGRGEPERSGVGSSDAPLRANFSKRAAKGLTSGGAVSTNASNSGKAAASWFLFNRVVPSPSTWRRIG